MRELVQQHTEEWAFTELSRHSWRASGIVVIAGLGRRLSTVVRWRPAKIKRPRTYQLILYTRHRHTQPVYPDQPVDSKNLRQNSIDVEGYFTGVISPNTVKALNAYSTCSNVHVLTVINVKKCTSLRFSEKTVWLSPTTKMVKSFG